MLGDRLKKALEEAENKFMPLDVPYANIMWIIPSSPSWQGKEIKAVVLDIPELQNKTLQAKAIPSVSPALVMVDAEKELFYVMYIHPALRDELRVGYAIKFKIANGRLESMSYADLGDVMEDIRKLMEKFWEELRKAYAVRSETWRVVAEYYGLTDEAVFGVDDVLPDF